MVASVFSRVKMSALDGVASSRKNAGREGFWYQMELDFTLTEDKDRFFYSSARSS